MFWLEVLTFDQEVENLRKQAMQRFGGQVDPNNMPELPAELFEQQAKDRVRTGLLLGEFIKANEIKANDDFEAVGGMRNQAKSVSRIHQARTVGARLLQVMQALLLAHIRYQ